MALISDNFNALTLATDLDDSSNWAVWGASGSGIARVDDHDDHSDVTQVIDMSNTGINWCIYQTNVDSANHYVEADVFIDEASTSGNEVGVIARGNNASMGSSVWDGYLCVFETATGTGSRVHIYRVDNDIATQLAVTSDIQGTYDRGTMHLLRFEVDGSTLTAFMNGTQELQTTDSTYSSGQNAGCYINRNTSGATSQPFFDNFEADSLAGDPIITAESGSFVQTGTVASLEYGRLLDAATASYVLTGTAASLERGYKLTAESGAFVQTGTDANLIYSGAGAKDIIAESGTFVQTGTAADLLRGYKIQAESGSFVQSGTDANLEYGRKVAIDSGTFTQIGTAASLLRGYKIDAATAAYDVTGQTVAFPYNRVITSESGTYVLTGSDVSLISSADVREFLVLSTPIIRELAKTTTITRTKVLTNTVTRDKVLSTKILQ